MFREVASLDGDITFVQRTGGYYKWSWKFPFRHFVKERLMVFLENKVYEIVDN